MSIRLRHIDGVGLVALCAARSIPKAGDIYLDDAAHHALSQKFWREYPELGIGGPLEAEIAAVVEQEESNNPNRADWDRAFGPSRPPRPASALWDVVACAWVEAL